MQMTALSQEQTLRYARNIALPFVGDEGQQRLLATRVTIVGCGALGSVAAMYLAGSGVGTLTIVDFDTIDVSNLQRQPFYTMSQLGESKARSLAASVKALNPDVKVNVVETLLRSEGMKNLLGNSDIVLECSDNPSTKLMVSDNCRTGGVPCVIGGVSGTNGQVLGVGNGTPGFREIFGDDPGCTGFTPCGAGGVFAPAAAIVAASQVAEAIKIALGQEETLIGHLLMVDTLTMTFRKLKI